MWERLPKFLKSYYFIFGVLFLAWMIFFDANDLYSQLTLRNKLKTLEQERQYYLEKIEEVKREREELLSDKELLEKFAREKYLMKRPTEDLYIIVEEK